MNSPTESRRTDVATLGKKNNLEDFVIVELELKGKALEMNPKHIPSMRGLGYKLDQSLSES